jgi:hypothetical protein
MYVCAMTCVLWIKDSLSEELRSSDLAASAVTELSWPSPSPFLYLCNGSGSYLESFPLLGLLEERALLLGRMGKHEQALFIYVHVLKDTKMAKE